MPLMSPPCVCIATNDSKVKLGVKLCKALLLSKNFMLHLMTGVRAAWQVLGGTKQGLIRSCPPM